MKSLWLTLPALLLSACGDGSSYLAVTIDSATPLTIEHLEVTIENGGQSATLGITHGASFSIPPAQSFNLKLDGGRRGDVAVVVRAFGPTGSLGEHSSTVTIIPGGTAHLLVSLGEAVDGGAPPDMTKLPIPVITAAFPDKGSTAGGTRISLTGDDFYPGFSVSVAGIPATDLRWDKKTQITFTMPSKPGTMGVVPVVVTNPDGQSATNTKALSYFPGTLGFLEPKPYGVGSAPVTLAGADFNKDDHIDIVTGNIQSSDVSVLLGRPDGSFDQERRLLAGNGTGFVATADINGDGLPDIVANNFNGDSIGVITNKGTGQFAPIVFFPAGKHPGPLATADFNRDGHVDVIVLQNSTDTASVLIGDGSGTFGAPLSFATGKGPNKVIAADFDGLGKPGVAITASGDNQVFLFSGRGDGTFREDFRLPTGVNPQGVAIADLNHDKLLDVVTSNLADGSVTVELNGGTFGMWTRTDHRADSGTRDVAVGDFNGDGNLDIASANGSFVLGPPSADTISVFIGNGDGSFLLPRSFAAHGSPQALFIADFDKDGRQDIAAANSQGQVAIFINSSQ